LQLPPALLTPFPPRTARASFYTPITLYDLCKCSNVRCLTVAADTQCDPPNPLPHVTDPRAAGLACHTPTLALNGESGRRRYDPGPRASVLPRASGGSPGQNPRNHS
jgi:hypothetical protein